MICIQPKPKKIRPRVRTKIRQPGHRQRVSKFKAQATIRLWIDTMTPEERAEADASLAKWNAREPMYASEIASVMGVSKSYVEEVLANALAKLRKALDKAVFA